MRIATVSIILVCSVAYADASSSTAEQGLGTMDTLVTSAEAEFGPLGQSRAFLRVLQGASKGVPTTISSHERTQLDISKSDTEWEQDQILDAKHIQWLCTSLEASTSITSKGVFVVGARIKGTIDLSFATLAFPLTLVNCSIPNGLRLHQSNLKTLVLTGSHIGPVPSTIHTVSAHGATIAGNVILSKGFTSWGELHFTNSTIAGTLDLGGASLRNQKGTALSGEGMSVTGPVFFYDGSEIHGIIQLTNSKLGSQLVIKNTNIKNPGKTTLNASGASIKGGVFFSHDTKSDGEIRLVGTKIESNIECTGSHLTNLEETALDASGASISGSIRFSQETMVFGELNFDGSDIGGNAEFANFIINNPNKNTLNLQMSRIGGSVFLKSFKSKGRLNLPGMRVGSNFECIDANLTNPGDSSFFGDQAAINGSLLFLNTSSEGKISINDIKIGSNLDCEGAILKNSTGSALTFHNAKIDGAVYLRAGFHAIGSINLIGAKIGSNFELSGAIVKNPSGQSILADRASIAGSLKLDRGFLSEGEVRLQNVSMGGNLDCTGGEFISAGGAALDASNISIIGNLFLRDGFHTNGEILLVASNVHGVFVLRNQRANGSGTYRLDLREARVGVLADEVHGWPVPGNYSISGFTYDRIADFVPSDLTSRLAWVAGNRRNGGYQPQPYTQLAEFLEDAGQESDARDVRISREKERSRVTAGPMRRIWDFFLRITVAYGYKPGRAVWWAVAICALSSAIFWWAGKSGAMVPSDTSVFSTYGANGLPKNYPEFDPLIYALDTFLPIIDLQQRSHWIPVNSLGNQSGGLWLWQRFTVTAGWVLTTLLVASFSGIIKA